MLGENRITPVAVKELSLTDLQAFPVSTICTKNSVTATNLVLLLMFSWKPIREF